MKQSAGVLLYRGDVSGDTTLEVLLVHPGGPFWAKKDEGAWSIPKGEFVDDELPLEAAKREFAEELGVGVPSGDLLVLGESRQSSGKVVHAWALHADLDPQSIRSNTFELEWPPRSGKLQQFPEVDRAAWFRLDVAISKLVKGQRVFIERLAERLGCEIPEGEGDAGTSAATSGTTSQAIPASAPKIPPAADATSEQTKLF